MAKFSRVRMRRVRNLVAVCALTAIILSISTFAWFVGMRSVNIASFDVEIEAAESLSLSLNGADWMDTITISQDTLDELSYVNHTNNWPKLIPMTTIGEMDLTKSRLKLYEKASATTTKGGFRIMTSRANNTGAAEANGYVVFDLFVKNFSGNEYYTELNANNEEAIYLTIDSAVKIADAGGVAGTGIENSVRVAFAQIGRVKANTSTASKITGIDCNLNSITGQPSYKDDITGICRTAQIWEPNDIRHVEAAIKWYDSACKPRKSAGSDITLASSYDLEGTCEAVEDGKAYPTYAANSAINSSDNVDVYDGEEYNTYENTTKLSSIDYFTDTMKLKTGTSRPEFMTLAPNSITKIRIYVFIEGQDIDNYDFSSIGKKISVQFGFTKERFTPGDIEYEGPEITVDNEAPILSLKGASPLILSVGNDYTEGGAIAVDKVDGDISSKIVIDATAVNTDETGEYIVTYTITDAKDNTTTVNRKVIVR